MAHTIARIFDGTTEKYRVHFGTNYRTIMFNCSSTVPRPARHPQMCCVKGISVMSAGLWNRFKSGMFDRTRRYHLRRNSTVHCFGVGARALCNHNARESTNCWQRYDLKPQHDGNENIGESYMTLALAVMMIAS